MAGKNKKGTDRLTATLDIGEFAQRDNNKSGITEKKNAYVTVYEDELKFLGLKGVATTTLKKSVVKNGKFAGTVRYSAVDDTATTGRDFQFLYPLPGARKKLKNGKKEARKYESVPIYFPTWMTTFQIMGWVAKLKKKPSIVVTDLGTRVRVGLGQGTRGNSDGRG